MIARCAAVLVTVSAIVSASGQSPPSDKPVTSATARVIRKAVDAQFVHIENRRNEHLFKLREDRAEQRAFWITALKDATRQSPAEVLGFLGQKRSERRREAPNESDLMGDNLDAWPKRADAASVPAFLDSYRATLDQQHALLTRHLKK